MERRDLIRSLGAAAAVALLPREALAAWARVAVGSRPAAGLSPAHLALVDAVADAIIPRTDTPGASDVGVSAFVDVIVSENYTDADRDTFTAGLDALATALAAELVPFTGLDAAARGAALGRVEALADRRVEPARTYWRLKGLVVHGYFTSEPVMKNVLKVQVMPGAFDGNAPHVVASPPPRRGAENGPARSAAENGL